MRVFGGVLILVAVFAFLVGSSMDTTVATGLGDRVHNIGLIQEKQGVIRGAEVIAIIGAIFFVFGSRSKKAAIVETDTPKQKTRKCPLCAEEILFEARRCKHCQADIEPPKEETIEETAQRLGVTQQGSVFHFQQYQYTRLEDAVAQAKRVNGES